MGELEAVNQRFGIGDVLKVTHGEGGLPCIDVKSEAGSGRVYLQGAHIAAWQPAGHQPVLFGSAQSWYEPGKPIRGGVPICAPWFGPKAGDAGAPAHGFVRILPWEIEATRLGDGGKVAAVLVLKSSEATKKYWPHDFEMRLRVTFGTTLIMKLEMLNTGTTAFSFEEALHTYFAVGDIRKVRVLGLEDTDYLDKTEGFSRKHQHGPVTVSAETDRMYLDTQAACVLEDPSLGRKITIEKIESRTTVVWNPWSAKAKAMPDFGDAEWPGMLCIETCNVNVNKLDLAPGAMHQMRAIVGVERM